MRLYKKVDKSDDGWFITSEDNGPVYKPRLFIGTVVDFGDDDDVEPVEMNLIIFFKWYIVWKVI